MLTELRSVFEFANDLLSAKDGSWCVNQKRKLGHLYIVWESDICFTESEIRRLHKHFFHPSDAKLMGLIARALPDEETRQTRSTVEKVRLAFDGCQRNSRELSRFRVSIPADECVFNHTFALDIMLLSGDHLLHCVDMDIKFIAVAFLPGETASNVWDTLKAHR